MVPTENIFKKVLPLCPGKKIPNRDNLKMKGKFLTFINYHCVKYQNFT